MIRTIVTAFVVYILTNLVTISTQAQIIFFKSSLSATGLDPKRREQLRRDRARYAQSIVSL